MKNLLVVLLFFLVVGFVAYVFVDYEKKILPDDVPEVIHATFGSAKKKYKEEDFKMKKRMERFDKVKKPPKI